jgi:hypothetical protein
VTKIISCLVAWLLLNVHGLRSGAKQNNTIREGKIVADDSLGSEIQNFTDFALLNWCTSGAWVYYKLLMIWQAWMWESLNHGMVALRSQNILSIHTIILLQSKGQRHLKSNQSQDQNLCKLQRGWSGCFQQFHKLP